MSAVRARRMTQSDSPRLTPDLAVARARRGKGRALQSPTPDKGAPPVSKRVLHARSAPRFSLAHKSQTSSVPAVPSDVPSNDPQELRKGAKVSLHGLPAASLNGQNGVLHRFIQSTGLWQIRMSDGELKKVKPDNLRLSDGECKDVKPGSLRSDPPSSPDKKKQTTLAVVRVSRAEFSPLQKLKTKKALVAPSWKQYLMRMKESLKLKLGRFRMRRKMRQPVYDEVTDHASLAGMASLSARDSGWAAFEPECSELAQAPRRRILRKTCVVEKEPPCGWEAVLSHEIVLHDEKAELAQKTALALQENLCIKEGRQCDRCFTSLVEGGSTLECGKCHLIVHRTCTFPVLSGSVFECLSALGSIWPNGKAWTCETCAQEEASHYDFCVHCGSGEELTDNPIRSKMSSLLKCSSCRSSLHRRCAGIGPFHRITAGWQCSQCKPDQCARVELSSWSLKLVQQSGRFVPVVQGIREDLPGPKDAQWQTAEIIHAVSSKELRTRTGVTVLLRGKLSRKTAGKLQLPLPLVDQFAFGFPPATWMLVLRQALNPTKDQGIHAACAGGKDRSSYMQPRDCTVQLSLAQSKASTGRWRDAGQTTLLDFRFHRLRSKTTPEPHELLRRTSSAWQRASAAIDLPESTTRLSVRPERLRSANSSARTVTEDARLQVEGAIYDERGYIALVKYEELKLRFEADTPSPLEVNRNGLKSYDESVQGRVDRHGRPLQGKGWIACHPNKKTVQRKFNVRTWGSWNLTYRLARLQRDVWELPAIQEAGNEEQGNITPEQKDAASSAPGEQEIATDASKEKKRSDGACLSLSLLTDALGAKCAAGGVAAAVVAAAAAAAEAESSGLAVGARVRRLFKDGGFHGCIEEMGLDSARRESILIAYDDGFCDLLTRDEIAKLKQDKVLSIAQDDAFSDGEDARPRKRLRKCPERLFDCRQLMSDKCAPWTAEQIAAFDDARRDIKPCMPQYWQLVAERVGRSAAECEMRSYETQARIRHHPAAKAQESLAGPADLIDPQSAQLAVPDNFAKQDGPRRAKQLRAFVSAHSFASGQDFFLSSFQESRSDGIPTSIGGSPPSSSSTSVLWLPKSTEQFLERMHTGHSPPRSRRVEGIRPLTLFAEDPCRGSGLLSIMDEEKCDDADAPMDDERSGVVEDLVRPNWRPKGLDAFVSSVRARRRQAASATIPKPARRGTTANAGRLALKKLPGMLALQDNEAQRQALDDDEDLLFGNQRLKYWSDDEGNDEIIRCNN